MSKLTIANLESPIRDWLRAVPHFEEILDDLLGLVSSASTRRSSCRVLRLALLSEGELRIPPFADFRSREGNTIALRANTQRADRDDIDMRWGRAFGCAAAVARHRRRAGE
jgi:hypothetical protein